MESNSRMQKLYISSLNFQGFAYGSCLDGQALLLMETDKKRIKRRVKIVGSFVSYSEVVPAQTLVCTSVF